jgi:hypothetical protein
MASIPDRFIREKDIDYGGELLATLGCGLVANNKRLKPFSLGVMSLLELMDNKCLKGTSDATCFDFGAIFYINDMRQEAIEDVADYSRGLTDPLERKVASYIKKNKLSIIQLKQIEKTIESAFTGFDMLPKDGGGGGLWLFGADTLAGLAFSCCSKLGVDYNTVWWDTPLALIGHIVAVSAVSNGAKGVGRRKDINHLKSLFKKCKQWDEEKKMYPWQWMEPIAYSLESYQDSKEIKLAYKNRLKEVKNG